MGSEMCIRDSGKRDSGQTRGPTQSVGDHVGGAGHVLDVGGELGDEGEVARLSRRLIGRAGQSATKWLVIRPNGERPPFQEMPEVANGEIDSQELTVKGRVLDLGAG